MARWPRAALLTLGLLILTAGCASRSPAPGATNSAGPVTASPVPSDSPAGSTASAQPSTLTWGSGPRHVTHQVAVPPVPVLRAIRSAAHPEGGYQRVVFDFTGPIPSYDVQYVDSVRADGSDSPVAVPGRRYLEIVFKPAQAHTEAGAPTIARTASWSLAPLRGYALAGDFEGVVHLALGLDDVQGYRLGETATSVYLDIAA